MSFGLHVEMNKEWDAKVARFHSVAKAFPIRAAAFYAAEAELGKKAVQDELMARVYNTPLPKSASFGGEPSPRTGRTLLNVKASWTALRSTVFVDRRGFPAYFYPWVLEHGRKVSPAYYARRFFQAAMQKMEVRYFRDARIFLKDFLFERGLL